VDTRAPVKPLSLRISEEEDGRPVVKAHAQHYSGGPLQRQWGQIAIGEECTMLGLLVSEPTLQYAKPVQLRVTGSSAGTYRLARLDEEDLEDLEMDFREPPLIDASEFLGLQGDERTGRFEAVVYGVGREGEKGASRPTEIELQKGDAVSVLWEATGNRRCVHFVCVMAE
jgi:hypothetical protein